MSTMSSSVCLYYKRGSCQFGNRCWNSHDLGSISSDSPYTVQGDSSDGESSFAVTKSRETTSTAASTSSSASRPKQKNQVLPNSANKSSETKAATPKDKWSLTKSWTRRVNHCPTCQVNVKNKSYCLTLDVYLDKISDCLPDETKTRRETLKVERNYVQGVFWDERDRNGAEWNIALEEPFFDTISLGDVLGRNRDDRDEWDEMTDWYYNTFDF
ncbi:hypothetical protein ACI65C_006450 [Semiaphis heraclei]